MSEKQEIVPYKELQSMAVAISSSGLFGMKTPEQAIALMLIAQADGVHPAAAARDYDIIQGRPAKKSEAMMRQYIAAGGTVEWHTLSDTCADATFSHPQGGKVRIVWDMARAEKAELSGKAMYKKYPRQMLRARCVSEGVRTVCPVATGGLYTPEEIEAMPPKEMGPAEVVSMPQSISEPKEQKPKEGEVIVAEDVQQPQPKTIRKPDAPPNTAPIGDGPKRLIQATLKAQEISEAGLCKQFSVKTVDDLTMDKVNDILKWIKNPN